ncbi:DUF6266 family protein [Pedobacter sp. MC2016-14]|uniref:DUF6266 family protein n=1 Tax=Pedobacter sp. MC2016-14 TaxID=2897327 RepID=UPI001E531121|nr:DUF6266 family protein [Pedobacter sp. MC2016-14]MCD0490558.1 DUF6266 family protein [Pedobacter sp. MC2016-14]
MAILKNGLFGETNGKLGAVVTYQLGNKVVARTIGTTTKPPTAKQLANRQRFILVNRFLKPIFPFVKVGFSMKAAEMNLHPYNLAVSMNMKNALTGNYPDVAMDFAKVQLAAGLVGVPENPKVEMLEDALNFTWKPGRTESDQVMLMAYFPALEKVIYLMWGAKRSEGHQLLPIPALLMQEYMETYMVFIRADRRAISNSIYTGSFNK